jgi:hypothetical protein
MVLIYNNFGLTSLSEPEKKQKSAVWEIVAVALGYKLLESNPHLLEFLFSVFK